MRICYLNHDLSNKTGAGRFCLALTSSLKRIRPEHEYNVITYDDLFPRGNLSLIPHLLKLRSSLKNYDIVHALDGWPYGFIAVLCSRGLKSKKVVITAIGTGAVKPLHHPLKKRLMMWAYKKADIVTAVSQNTRREILKVMPNLIIKVINHGVDFSKFQITNYQLPITNLRPYILSVGALKKRKGYKYSIKAFAEIAAKFPELKYVIVGQGLEQEKLESLVMSHGLQDRVVFLSDIGEDHLISLYQNAELFILLPQDIGKDIEGFGLVFLEAAAGGLPVIATKGSGAEDAVFDGRNGILVSQNDHPEATAALSRILNDERLKERFSSESKVVAASMGWDKVAWSYLGVYDYQN